MITFEFIKDSNITSVAQGDIIIGTIEEINVSKKSKVFKCQHEGGLSYESPTIGVARKWFEQFRLDSDIPVHEMENENKEKQEGERVLLTKIAKLESANKDLSSRNLKLQEIVTKMTAKEKEQCKTIEHISDKLYVLTHSIPQQIREVHHDLESFRRDG